MKVAISRVILVTLIDSELLSLNDNRFMQLRLDSNIFEHKFHKRLIKVINKLLDEQSIVTDLTVWDKIKDSCSLYDEEEFLNILSKNAITYEALLHYVKHLESLQLKNLI